MGGEQLKTAVGETNVAIHRQKNLHTHRTPVETNAISNLISQVMNSVWNLVFSV